MEGNVLNHFLACSQLQASENTWPEPTLYGVLYGGLLVLVHGVSHACGGSLTEGSCGEALGSCSGEGTE